MSVTKGLGGSLILSALGGFFEEAIEWIAEVFGHGVEYLFPRKVKFMVYGTLLYPQRFSVPVFGSVLHSVLKKIKVIGGTSFMKSLKLNIYGVNNIVTRNIIKINGKKDFKKLFEVLIEDE